MKVEQVVSASPEVLTGTELLRLFGTAQQLLQENVEQINALNVFPVPDGDTGLNMLLTLKAALNMAYQEQNSSAAKICAALAKGALLGAKGNSGVILSQFFKGLALGAEGKFALMVNDFALALNKAKICAYQAVAEPVEGTVLTVMQRVAEAAQLSATNQFSLEQMFHQLSETAKQAVANTPELLHILKEAGVVDAGGQGLFVILEGMHRALMDEKAELTDITPRLVSAIGTINSNTRAVLHEPHDDYGYCTNFLLQGQDLSLATIKNELSQMGQSLVAIGDEQQLKVHIHTQEPGAVLSYAAKFGILQQIQIYNMDEQAKAQSQVVAASIPQQVTQEVGIVAVAWGEGLIQLFKNLGIQSIIQAGDTMNPSTQEILQAIEAASAAKIILLPNNPNIIAAAKLAAGMATKEVEVLPTKTMQQGLAASMAYMAAADFVSNCKAMQTAMLQPKSIAITTANRSVTLNGIEVKQGQLIGLLENNLAASADNLEEIVLAVLAKASISPGQLITFYAGHNMSGEANRNIEAVINKVYNSVEVEFVYGGQPYYNYIISIE